MAMLAEPRRKARYVVNPSGKDWVQAGGGESRFGHRMLRSMGWSEGRGLGKDCQGSAQPIRVRHKTDQRGVGCSGAYAAENTPQSVDFASLLSQLNAAHAAGCHDNHHNNSNSLEAKSRASRARLHYHRFTRGKDVSAYDSRALACILGSREPPPPGQAEEVEKKETEDDEEEAAFRGFGFSSSTQQVLNRSQSELSLTTTAECRQGLQLVQSQTSLQEYFKAKMQARQQQQQQQVDNNGKDEKEAADAAASSWTSESSCSIASTSCGSPTEAKRVRFSLSAAPEAEAEPEALTIDFGLFPGCELQWILGYPLY